ncbi:hypothetical protein HUU40_22130 [candidate division KSB1 bacterium]|nr:hypothetical protein [candidate division KSB1 bacterium]
MSDPDAGFPRNAGLAFGHDMRLFFRQRTFADALGVPGGVSSNTQTGRLL